MVVNIALRHPIRVPFADGNVLCLDCINVNLMFVILYYSFVVCYHWRKLDKVYLGSFCIISYNNM